jgi:predicted Zn-dependent peptidase
LFMNHNGPIIHSIQSFVLPFIELQKVISKETGSSSAAVGLSVGAGSRFGSSGEALLLKHLAFKGTDSRSDIKLARDLEAVNLTATAAGGRDSIFYGVSGLPGAVSCAGLQAVAESVLTPKLVGWNVSEVAAESAAVELKEAEGDAQVLLAEKIHEAAYGEGTPMGSSYYTKGDGAGLAGYMQGLYVPSNMTLVGAGLSHASLVKAAGALFPGGDAGSAPAVSSPVVGGTASLKASSPVTHVALAFPGAAAGSKDYFTALVYRQALCGAAGPAASAFSVSYTDSGLVGLYGCAEPSAAGALTEDMVKALKAPLSEADILASKMAVKTQLLVAAEDSTALAPALAAVGAAADGSGVDAVTAAQVQAFAKDVVKGAVSIATVGSAAAVPSYSSVLKMF